MIEPIDSFLGLTCTINTTEDCNLRCKYCYEVNKCNKTINMDYCKKFIDIVTADPSTLGPVMEKLANKGIVFDFIGGDSLMNVDIVDEAMSYIVYKLNKSNHPAKDNYRFSISTNGTLFGNMKVRNFCEKWQKVLDLSVSIDGCPEIHDMNRVFPNGEGSMSKILEWWPWYQKVFDLSSKSTKSTLAKNSIPYLYDSLKFMHEDMGIDYIYQNFIMEDMHCTDADWEELDRQFEKCVDYVLEHRHDLWWRPLSYKVGEVHEELPHEGFCGSGGMPALGIDGYIYPCFRWLPHTMKEGNTKYQDFRVGHVNDIEPGKMPLDAFLRVQEGACRDVCTTEEKCKKCEYESVCPYCIAGGFAETGKLVRLTHICNVTKMQEKWGAIYWRKYNEIENA